MNLPVLAKNLRICYAYRLLYLILWEKVLTDEMHACFRNEMMPVAEFHQSLHFF